MNNRYAAEDFGNEEDIYVGGTLVLRTRPAFERMRAIQMAPLLQKHGVQFVPHPYDYKYPVKDPWVPCYLNAGETALKEGLIYCEGLMLLNTQDKGVQSLAHGWCCKPNGMIVDPTCPKYQNTDMIRYLGIPFKTEYLKWWFDQVGYYGMLDGHHQYAPMGVYHDDPAKFVQSIAPEVCDENQS